MKFTYYTIIGKDLNLFKGHVENIKKYAGFDQLQADKEFIAIVYTNKNIPQQVTDSILQYCKEQEITPILYPEPHNIFISNLYACWNLGYQSASDGYVFRAGSDQVFSRDSILAIYNKAEELRLANPKKRVILQANTIENSERIAAIGAQSRHFCEQFGNNFDEFDFKSFESFIERINEKAPELLSIKQALEIWGHPTSMDTTLGRINRTDGCSWLMTKKDFHEYGPLPIFESGLTGDVVIHDRFQRAGYFNYIVRDCVTYHFVRGESMHVY